MRFFETTAGTEYPIARIEWIGREREVQRTGWTKKVRSVRLADLGDSVEVDNFEYRKIMRQDRAIIPAQPGYFLLGRWHEIDAEGNRQAETWREPVIAFYFDSYGSPEPVTPNTCIDDLEDRSGRNALLSPCGQVLGGSADGATWGSLGEWEASMDKIEFGRLEAKAKGDSTDGD